MALNGEEIVCGLINFVDGCLEGCLDAEEGEYLGDFYDSKSDKGCQDIAEMLPDDPFGMETLPVDPFGMEIKIEATVEVITGWMEDLGLGAYGFQTDEDNNDDNRLKTAEDDDNSFFLVLTRSMEYEQEDWESGEVDTDSMIYTGNNSYIVEDSWSFGCEKYEVEHVKDVKDGDGGAAADIISMIYTENSPYNVEDSMCFGCEKYEIDHVKDENHHGDGAAATDIISMIYKENSSRNVEDSMCLGCEKYKIVDAKDENNGDGGAAVDTIIFVLGYLNLGIKDLLTIEMVCKPLRDAVRKDPYIWTQIHIDYPLCKTISNDDLLRLTDRAQGKLCSLGLVKCMMITNDGLQQVLERNLELTKLSVAGSNKLSLEGVLNNLKLFNSVAKPGIKHLRIGDIKHQRIGDMRNEYLRELKLLLGADEDSVYKPRFYGEELYLSLDDERPIDIETCPRCQMLKQVYDCPTENCRVTSHSTKACKACTDCIARCIQCGCCLDDKAYEELFSFDLQCFDCDVVKLSAGRSCLASYHVFLYS